jgi:hypothetical protein
MDSTEAVNALVSVWVSGQACAVGISSDTGWIVVDPVTHDLVASAGILCLGVNGSSHEVTPAFTHTTGFTTGETSGVGRAAGETVGQAVCVLVDDNTSVETAVALGRAVRPEIHPHTAGLTVSGCSKVGVVGTASVLSVEDNHVVSLTTLTIVVNLEVASLFSKAKKIEEIVVLVGCVEKLGDGSIAVGGRCSGAGGVVILKFQRRAIRTVVIQIG